MKGLNRARVVMKGLISARAHLECLLSLHGSVLKCIKSDRKIQDMWQKMYIFMFHMIQITQRVQFLSSKISTVTNVILILYKNKLIPRDLHFRHHIACFCCISSTKNNSKQPQRCFASLSNMSDSFLNESMNRLNDSLQTQWLTC